MTFTYRVDENTLLKDIEIPLQQSSFVILTGVENQAFSLIGGIVAGLFPLSHDEQVPRLEELIRIFKGTLELKEGRLPDSTVYLGPDPEKHLLFSRVDEEVGARPALSGSLEAVLILRDVQPLPYIHLERVHLILYHLSYPLRVLGIFFTGLIFAGITSPIEFLRWGELGMRIALLYRAFPFSVLSISDIRKAMILQGEWPERSGGGRAGRNIGMFVKGTPVLVATIFRNIILWFPWAWICCLRFSGACPSSKRKIGMSSLTNCLFPSREV